MTVGVGIGLVAEVLDVFERHGLHYRDDEHTGGATLLVQDAAMVYDAQRDMPNGTAICGTALTGAQLERLVEMCQLAQECVTAGIETCEDCDGFVEGICPPHSYALACADAYRRLARKLGAAAYV